MAVDMLWDASLVFNSVNLSNRVRSVLVSRNHEDLEATAMGSPARGHFPGLRDDSMEIEFYQDYASGSVEATIGSALGTGAGFTTIAKPYSGAVAVTNPSYTGTLFPMTHQPISGTVGDMNMTNVTLVPAIGSSIAKATA